jgi:hypothetical protein
MGRRTIFAAINASKDSYPYLPVNPDRVVGEFRTLAERPDPLSSGSCQPAQIPA